MTLLTFAILWVAAFLTATLSGILGMGGGMTLLAVMALLMPPAAVIPVHGAVQLASNATRTTLFWNQVHWPIVRVYAGLVAVGVGAATLVWEGDKMTWFRPVIGVMLLVYLGLRRWKPTLRNVPMWTYAPLGLVVGFLTVFVGATGPVIAPFFLRDELDKEQVIATKAVCQTWTHLLKLPAFLALGFDFAPWLLPLASMVVAVVAGTAFGKWLLSRLSRERFEQLFIGLVVVLAMLLVGR